MKKPQKKQSALDLYHLFIASLPHGRISDEQATYIRIFDTYLKSKENKNQHPEVCMINADTGIGKTYSYLLPLALDYLTRNRKSIISTQTNLLIHQITEENGPEITRFFKEHYNADIKIRPRFSYTNFLDYDTIERALASHTTPDRLKIALAELDPQKHITIHDVSRAGIDVPFPFTLHDYTITSLFDAGERAQKSYEKHVAEAEQAQIIVTNHSTSVLNALYFNNLLDVNDKPTNFIFDEAENIEAVTTQIGQPVFLTQLETLIDKLIDPPKKKPHARSLPVCEKASKPISNHPAT